MAGGWVCVCKKNTKKRYLSVAAAAVVVVILIDSLIEAAQSHAASTLSARSRTTRRPGA